MFEGLKRVLGLGKKKKEETPVLEELPAPETPITETKIDDAAPASPAAPVQEVPKPEPKPEPVLEEEEEEAKRPSIFSRLKTLVVER